jgi:maltose alpha-D-glucosyltransferase/alpha-amylase
MAASLVKGDDEKKTGTSRIWKEIRAMLDKDYPECALVAEWSHPDQSLPAGFHADFLLNEPGGSYSSLVRDY